MRIVLLVLVLGGCTALPSGNAECEQQAAAAADRTTRPEQSVPYMLAWRGRYEDVYARCTAGR